MIIMLNFGLFYTFYCDDDEHELEIAEDHWRRKTIEQFRLSIELTYKLNNFNII